MHGRGQLLCSIDTGVLDTVCQALRRPRHHCHSNANHARNVTGAKHVRRPALNRIIRHRSSVNENGIVIRQYIALNY